MSKVVTAGKLALTCRQKSSRQSTIKSAVSPEGGKYTNTPSSSGKKIPKGGKLSRALKSWSTALTITRLCPCREKGPTLTVAFASIDRRKVVLSSCER